jgi:predicted PurR-regulated permease PerM
MSKINIALKIFNFIIFLLIILVFLIYPIIKLKNMPKMLFNATASQNVTIDNSLFQRLDKAIENYLK